MEIGLKRGVCRAAELDGIGDQPHGRPRRKDVFLLRDVFLEDVVLQSSREAAPIDTLLLRHRQVHGPQNRGGRIDGHGDRDIAQRNSAEQDFHILERADRRAAFADFAQTQVVARVVAHQRGQVERHRESSLSLRQQVVVAAVGFLGRGEARELAHGPESAAVHVGVDAASEREFAGRGELKRTRSVDRFNRNTANCRKLADGGFHGHPAIVILTPPGGLDIPPC